MYLFLSVRVKTVHTFLSMQGKSIMEQRIENLGYHHPLNRPPSQLPPSLSPGSWRELVGSSSGLAIFLVGHHTLWELWYPWLNPILRDFHKIPLTITSQDSLISFFPITCMWRKGSWSKEGKFRSTPGELICTCHFCPWCWEISDSILCT